MKDNLILCIKFKALAANGNINLICIFNAKGNMDAIENGDLHFYRQKHFGLPTMICIYYS